MSAVGSISPDELAQLAHSGGPFALLDVREAGEAGRGHLLGATMMPRTLAPRRIRDLVPAWDTAIVLYDAGGADTRAAAVARLLREHGYADVRVLDGGAAGWAASGQPLVEGSNVRNKLFGERLFEHEGIPELPPQTLHEWIASGRPHAVLDIRTPQEHEASRIPGSRGAFGMDIARLAGDLAGQGIPVVVHCSGRTRGIIACAGLRALGVDQAFALADGTMGWLLAGFELETSPAKQALTPSDASIGSGRTVAQALGADAAVRAIGVAQLKEHIAQLQAGRLNLYLLDVRQLDEYLQGHVPAASALPGGLAVQRGDEFMPDRQGQVVLVDGDGEGRAWLTGYWLRRLGYAQVAVLTGGTAAWAAAGEPLARGRERSEPLGWKSVSAGLDKLAPADAAAASAKRLAVFVGPSRHYAQGHVPGSVWASYARIEVLAARHAKDQPLLLACEDGVLSAYAAHELARSGFRDVAVLAGGMKAWRAAGLQEEKGHSPESRAADDVLVPPYHSDQAEMRRYLVWERELTHSAYGALDL